MGRMGFMNQTNTERNEHRFAAASTKHVRNIDFLLKAIVYWMITFFMTALRDCDSH